MTLQQEYAEAERLAELFTEDIALQLLEDLPHHFCECGGEYVYHVTHAGFTVDIPGGRCVDCGRGE